MKSYPFYVLIAFLCFFLTGCGVTDPKDPQFVMVRGKGVVITRGEVDEMKKDYVARSGISLDQVPPEMLSKLDEQILDRKIVEVLVMNEGEKMQLPDLDKKVEEHYSQVRGQFKDEEKFQEQLKAMGVTADKIKNDIRNQIIMNEVLRSKVTDSPPPTPEVIAEFYKNNKQSFAEPKMVRASHVLVKVPEDADEKTKSEKKKIIEAALARIKKGEDFAKIAKEVSEDPGSAAKGGDLDFFPEGTMVPEFNKEAFSLKVGAISPVFETSYGFHFLKVTGKREARTVPMEEASARIASHLIQEERKKQVEDFVQKLKADADLHFFPAKPETAS